MLMPLVWTRLKSLRHKDRHKPRAEQKAKQDKILVILSSQVPEEKSCFVFVAYAYVARVNQALELISQMLQKELILPD